MKPESTTNQPDIIPFDSAQVEFSLDRDAWGRLRFIDRQGQAFEHVRVIPLFPITDPERWISICDVEGHELACVADPNQLSAQTRAIVLDELGRREFLPVIERIVRVSGNSEPCEWEVVTDCGPTRFVLESEDSVRVLDGGKVAIKDSHGIRYLIKDIQALDPKSRRIIEWYV